MAVRDPSQASIPRSKVSTSGKVFQSTGKFRIAGRIYVPDHPSAWEWAVRSVGHQLLASEGKPVLARVKRGAFELLSNPSWMCLFPRGEAHPDWAGFVDNADLVIKGHAGNWIIISASQERVTRIYRNRWQYLKARWIYNQPPVAAVSPRALLWDDERLFHVEEYIHGTTVAVHDLKGGVQAIRELWPRLAAVFRSQWVLRPLRPSGSRHSRAARELFEACGLKMMWERAHQAPVAHGLVHGDLKPLNIMRTDGRLVVIDWAESYGLRPQLFDVLYFLFWLSRSHPPGRVVEAAFCDGSWLLQVQPEIEANLVAFTREMMRRIADEGRLARRRLERQLGVFVRECARVLGAD